MDKLDKLKLASSSLGERLKTGGAQMSRLVSTKVKDLLQAPTPESKLVDQATLDTMEEPNWRLNLRICAMINAQQLSGAEIVKAIKRKLSGKIPITQSLSLDLLEACTSNCDKMFSEVASEKLLDDMMKIIDDTRTELANRKRAWHLIRSWGESEDLMYLPVFRQTYQSLKTRVPPEAEHPTLGSYMDEELMLAPEQYPFPDMGLPGADTTGYASTNDGPSVEENKEFLSVTRNTLDLLSSILNSETEPKPIKDDLMVSLLEQCKHSLPSLQRIAERTIDDEAMLVESLSLHDEIRQVISKYKELETALQSGGQQPERAEASLPIQMSNQNETKVEHGQEVGITESSGEHKKTGLTEEGKC